MSALDDIFPPNPRYELVQTQWSEGWAYAVIGFAGAARMLTEQRARMHASVDQIGLAVFFLQRHRTELAMKYTLVTLGEDPTEVAQLGHSLDKLWAKLGEVVRASDAGHWAELDGRYSDFVSAMHEADAGSFAYRYPITTKGDASQRAPFIDLDALERHAEDFETGLAGYTDMLDAQEQLRREYEAELSWGSEYDA